MSIISVSVLAYFRSPALLFSHGAIQVSVRHHALGGSSEGVGNGHVGWRAGLLCIFEAFSEELRRCSITRLGALRRHEPCRCFSRASSPCLYSIEFRTLAASCGWNEKALWDNFLHGLAEHVKDEIYSLELPAGLDGLIDLAIRVDDRIALHSRHRRGDFPASASRAPSRSPLVTLCLNASSSRRRSLCRSEERLTVGERRRRLVNQLCLYAVSGSRGSRVPCSGGNAHHARGSIW